MPYGNEIPKRKARAAIERNIKKVREMSNWCAEEANRLKAEPGFAGDDFAKAKVAQLEHHVSELGKMVETLYRYLSEVANPSRMQ